MWRQLTSGWTSSVRMCVSLWHWLIMHEEGSLSCSSLVKIQHLRRPVITINTRVASKQRCGKVGDMNKKKNGLSGADHHLKPEDSRVKWGYATYMTLGFIYITHLLNSMAVYDMINVCTFMWNSNRGYAWSLLVLVTLVLTLYDIIGSVFVGTHNNKCIIIII